MRRWGLGLWMLGALLARPPVAAAQPAEGGDDSGASESTSSPGTAEGAESTETSPAATQSDWWIGLFGYVRAAFEWVQEDPNVDFVGRNNGFVLHNARLGVEGGRTDGWVSFRVSIDGASDIRSTVNDPQGDLQVRLRDAYLRIDPCAWGGVQLGQFKVPFSAEELVSEADLRFASLAVGLEGVQVGRGREEPGIYIGRQLGVMISPRDRIALPAGFWVNYFLAATNGSGENHLLNDNNKLGYYGRIELGWQATRGDDTIVSTRLGGSVLSNDRTVGQLPNLFEENDFGWSADLLQTFYGLEIFAQITELDTDFPTTGTPQQIRRSDHVQVLYRFDLPILDVAPEYRFAYYHPRAEGGTDAGGINLDSYQLDYHTVGLVVWPDSLPLMAVFNYTFTVERAPRDLENNRLELLAQYVF